MLEKLSNPKGLNTRFNNINPDELSSLNSLNVYKDSNGNIRKIKSFDTELDIEDGVIDAYYYSTMKQIILVYQKKIKRVINLSTTPTEQEIPNIFSDDTQELNYTVRVSFAESGRNLYIADPAGNEELMKYDGVNFYRAGVPQSNISGTTSGPNFGRAILLYKDANGIETYGDYSQTTITDGSAVEVTYPEDKYGLKYGIPAFNVSPLLNPLERSFKIFTFTEHNFEVGDVIWGKNVRRDTYGDGFISEEVKMTVIAVNGLTVSFQYPELPERSEGIFFENSVSQMRVILSSSDSETYGYIYDTQNLFCIAPAAPNTSNFPLFTGGVVDSAELTEIYDDTIIKGIPPKLRYISMYANQLIGLTTKNTDVIDNLAWSDLGIGSSVEAFAPFDNQDIGKSDEGDSSGVFANTDHIVLFKKREIYYLYGILYGKQYRIVKGNTSGIGCISHKTIKSFAGGCTFLSDRGMYITTGQNPVELSENIEPTIQNQPNLEDSYVEFDYLNERAFLVFPDIMYEYNYYFNEWFTHDIITNSASFICVNNDKYEISQTELKKQGNNFNHIPYYRTAWQVKDAPLLRKKFINGALVSAYGDTFSVKMNVYSDWIETPVEEVDIEQVNPQRPIVKIECSNTENYSQSFEFFGVDPTEDFVISALGYEYEVYQQRIKDR